MKKKRFKIYVVKAVKWDFEYIEACNRLSSDDFSRWLQQKKRASYDKKTYPTIIQQWRGQDRERVWGYFRDLKIAKRSVIENWGFNFDEAGYYNGAIIEAVEEGYFSTIIERYFFKHKAKPTKKALCEEFFGPVKCYEQIVGLTMG